MFPRCSLEMHSKAAESALLMCRISVTYVFIQDETDSHLDGSTFAASLAWPVAELTLTHGTCHTSIINSLDIASDSSRLFFFTRSDLFCS